MKKSFDLVTGMQTATRRAYVDVPVRFGTVEPRRQKWWKLDWLKSEAARELEVWGYHKYRQITTWKGPKCTLAKIQEYGMVRIPAGYWEPEVESNPTADQVDRVLGLFPEEKFQIAFSAYVLGGTIEQKAARVAMTKNQFRYAQKAVIRLYHDVRESALFA